MPWAPATGFLIVLATTGLADDRLQASERNARPWGDASFFPTAVWLQDPRNAASFKAAGINLYVGLWRGPTDEQLDALKAAGMKLICHQNRAGLARKDDPAIAGWMHGDEPDNAQSKPGGGYGPPIPPETIVASYKKLRSADPSRPVLLNLGQGVAWDGYKGRGVRANHPEDYAEYLRGCDIASFDIYPVVHENHEIAGKLWMVPFGVDRLVKWSDGSKVVWNCIEASRIENPAAKPTADQVKAEVWMSLVHGSSGIIYFVHQFKPRFVEASLLQDADLLKGVTAINHEIHALAPVLNSPSIRGGVAIDSPSDAPVDGIVKRHGGATYLFAVAMRRATRAKFSLLNVGPASADVLGENRSIAVRNGSFEDEFAAFGVHLYRVGGP